MRNEGQHSKKTIWVLLSLVSVVTVAIVVLFLFGNMALRSKYANFVGGDGYVISSMLGEDGVTSTRQYFDMDTLYKSNYSGNVEFNNTGGETVSVAPDSFVHYLDGSVGFLKKVAVLDLASLKDEKNSVITYYNMFPSSILKYSAGNYVAELQGKRTVFDAVVIKSAENKYLVAAPLMNFSIDGSSNQISNGYLEITYFDGDIVRVENQEVTYQSIAKNMDILFGDMRVDLKNKRILKNNVNVLDFGMITIDSDDNIVLSNMDDKIEFAEEEQGAENALNQNNTNNNNNTLEGDEHVNLLGDLADGVIRSNTANDDKEQEINEYARSSDPVFIITSMDVTVNGFNAVVEVEDMDGLLTGDTYVEITEVATGKPMYQARMTDGEMRFETNTENLSPKTAYVFVVTANYYKDGAELTRSFIQKTFMTEAVGISLRENYISQDEISITIERSNYSDIENLSAVIYDAAGDEKANRYIEFVSGSNSQAVTFGGLLTNSEYTVVLKDFRYKNRNVEDAFSLQRKYVTSKKKPVLGGASFSIDKRESYFHINLDDVEDQDNAIVSYRYEVYEVDGSEDVPVYVVERYDRAGVDIKVVSENEDGKIKRDKAYKFKVVVTFNDNQREREYEKGFYGVMEMDGKAFPTVSFIESEITFEKIDGSLRVEDKGGVLMGDVDKDGAVLTDKTFMVRYVDSSGNERVFRSTIKENDDDNGVFYIPFAQNNLRKKETYVISVYGNVDLGDNNDPMYNCFIGSVIVKTDDSKPFMLSYGNSESSSDDAFSVKVKLASGNGDDVELEANVLSGITFSIYEGNNTAGDLVASVELKDENEDPYVSSLRGELYDKEDGLVINPGFFGKENSDFNNNSYTIQVSNAYDYTDYKNEIEIQAPSTFTVNIKNPMPNYPNDAGNAIAVTKILNTIGEEHYDGGLAEGTIIGYRLSADFQDNVPRKKMIKYTIHNNKTGEIIKEFDVEMPSGAKNPDDFDVYFDGVGTPFNEQDSDFRRGNEYYFAFTVLLDMDADGTPETKWPTEDDKVFQSKPVAPAKQAPKFLSYPVESDSDSFKWNYVLTDVDNALVGNELTYSLGNSEEKTVVVSTTGEDYESIDFDGLSQAGTLSVYYTQALTKGEEEDIGVINYRFEGEYEPNVPEYTLDSDDYKATISLIGYDGGGIYDRISYIGLVLRTDNGEMLVPNLNISNDGKIILNSSDYTNLIGQKVTPTIYFYYDNGKAGFGDNFSSNEYVAMERKDESGEYGYFSLRDENLSFDKSALGSYFKYELPIGNSLVGQKTLSLENIDNNVFPASVDFSSGGVKYNDGFIVPKSLSRNTFNRKGEKDSFTFNGVKPRISVEITPNLVGASISAKLYSLLWDGSGSNITNIKDNIIHVEVCETNNTGGNIDCKGRKDIEVERPEIEVKLEELYGDLMSNTKYKVYFYADVWNNSDYEEMLLYDANTEKEAVYEFTTLRSIAIDENGVDVRYYANSWDHRYLKIAHNLSSIVGIDRIEYKIYEDGTENLRGFGSITPTSQNVEANIEIPSSSSGVVAGKSYRIKISAYARNNSIDPVAELNSTVYYFKQLQNPISIIKSKKDGNKIEFSVRVFDSQQVVVGSSYQISILEDGFEDVTPIDYKGVNYAIGNGTKTFTLNGVEDSKKYVFRVKYKVDNKNDGEYLDLEKSYSVRAINDSSFYTGVISAVADLKKHNNIRLVFHNSNKLSLATRLDYIIYNGSTGDSESDTVEFVPTLVGSGNESYYYFTLSKVNLTKSGEYYVRLQFSDNNGNILGDESVDYVYMEE